MLLYIDTQISLKNGIFRNNIQPSCSGGIYFIRVVVVGGKTHLRDFCLLMLVAQATRDRVDQM